MSDLLQIRDSFYTFIQRYVDEVHDIITNPRDFFIRDAERSGFLEPATFAAFNLLIPKLFYALLLAPLTLGLSLLTILPSILYGTCLLFVAAIVLYIILRYMGGAQDFETIYRNVAYSSVAYYAWLLPIPFLNLLLFTLGFCTLLFFAIREVHGLDTQRTLIVLSAPAFLILLTGAILSIITIWVMVSGALKLVHYFYP